MLRKLLPLVLMLGSMACSDDSEEVLFVIDDNNQTNNSTNNQTVSQSNNETNNQTTGNNLVVFPRPDLVTLLEQDLVTAENGVAGPFQFDVPPNTQSVVITIVGDSPAQYTVRHWNNGDSSPLVNLGWLGTDPGAPSLCLGCPQRVTSSEAAFAAMAPTNPVVSIKPGTHEFSVLSFKLLGLFNQTPVAGPARVIVTAKVMPTVPTAGTLDVNLWFSGALGLTAATAATDTNFQKTLADVNAVYAQVGLKLGRITYNDIEGDFNVIENVIGAGSDLAGLFAQSANAPQDAVNVFFVEDLLTGAAGGQGFGILLGVSGGIPGPTGIMGTGRSGVVLALKRSPQFPSPLYKVFSHEVGHFLGLYHTSEQNLGGGQQIHDQLPDTPENDPVMVMHNSGNGDKLSASQGSTMRLNPWVRQEAE
jgi:hypothetical protein